MSEAVIRRVAERADHAVVFIDEAYHDFHGVNVLHLTREYPNVVDRPHLLQGPRAGRHADRRAGGAAARCSTPIRFVMPLFNLNSVAVAALRAALADTEFMPWYVAQARESKALLYEALTGSACATGRASELRAGRRRRRGPGAHRRDDRRRRAGARPQQGARLRQLLPVTTGVVEHTKKAIALLEALCAKG